MVVGHAYALLLGKWMVDDLQLHWVISLFTFTMIYLLTGILTCIIVPEKTMSKNSNEETTGEKICNVLSGLKNYYKRDSSNVLLLLEYCFLDTQGAMSVYWIPFFFM